MPLVAQVSYFGCNSDGTPDSCSAIEMQNGGSISLEDLGLLSPATGTFIGSGSNDGSETPDFTKVLLTGDLSRLPRVFVVWDHNIQIRADSAAGGNTYSEIEYQFQIFVSAGVSVYATEVILTASPFSNEHGQTSADLTIGGTGNHVGASGVAAVEPISRSHVVKLDPPLYGGKPGPLPSGNLFSGTLFVDASILSCPGGETCVAIAETVESGFFIEDVVVFADGFESGDTSAWTAP